MNSEAAVRHVVQDVLLPWGIKALLALLVLLVGLLLVRLLTHLVGRILNRTHLDKTLVGFIQSLLNTLLLAFVIITALDQLGVNTNSIIALLGAAGLAIGLALQNSLQNFAAGFMLLVFRPFRAGDTIEIASVSGTVERIRIFSTSIITGDNKQVIIPNGTIYSGNIINYSSMGTRRIDMVFGIGYNDDMKKARDLIARLIAADSRILQEPAALIAVGELGASSVNFYVRPWVKNSDYWPVKYALTEAIKQAFDDNGISIPFPQMDVHISKPQ